jgi:hypothetical protein
MQSVVSYRFTEEMHLELLLHVVFIVPRPFVRFNVLDEH